MSAVFFGMDVQDQLDRSWRALHFPGTSTSVVEDVPPLGWEQLVCSHVHGLSEDFVVERCGSRLSSQ